ncbi:MAG: GH3 auxin-responsive promoter family protein [Bacteroidia bacterium]|nr:GH3 auxin-responsive promoter family protein [Bacteroidia bacterium]
MDHVQEFCQNPVAAQEALLKQLISRAKDTEWGRHHGYGDIETIEDFRKSVPISNYETLYPWIERCIKGESDMLWPGTISWFSKSSGTTNDKSKYIPVTPEALDACHYAAGQDMIAMYLEHKPDSRLFTGKTLSIGGSHNIHKLNHYARYGDVSAVLLENLPTFYELMRTPSKSVALMEHWEEKIEAMAREVIQEDVTSMVGVPTWTMVLINKMFEITGNKDRNLLDIWPNLELYVHGGVSFEPYRAEFQRIIPSSRMTYLDCYNASEGFFAVQDDPSNPAMLLLLDYGVYYEFLPMEHYGEENPPTHTLAQVEVGRNYAVVISTNAGLWRYLIGDTIQFTETSPYRIRITGRTRHFINAFGEELMVDNAERAIAEACAQTQAQVSNYTAAPIYFEGSNKGGHEWLVEFTQPPADVQEFATIMDLTLQRLNSDYEAKRRSDLALLFPTFRVMPAGTFHHWMKLRGKLGGQHKVPRLANNREYVESILNLTKDMPSSFS